uniref:Uncharacterized protein n=1 Tax=Anguilla anguilla TaxID=7936 RepID=A0A0E9WWS2_ANGAN
MERGAQNSESKAQVERSFKSENEGQTDQVRGRDEVRLTEKKAQTEKANSETLTVSGSTQGNNTKAF